MTDNRLRKFILKLNRLRGKKRSIKRKNMTRNNIIPTIRKLTSDVNCFQFDSVKHNILDEHKNIMQSRRISPIFEQLTIPSQLMLEHSQKIENILKIHRDFLDLELVSPFPEPTVRVDPRISHMLKKHKDFLNLRPISPIPVSLSECRIQSSLENIKTKQTSQSLTNLTKQVDNLQACNFHLFNKLYTFCIDCFSIINGPSLSCMKNLNFIASCRRHIFTQPDKPCQDCFWVNYAKH